MNRFRFLAGLWLLIIASSVGAAPKKIIRIGFFEGGDYFNHALIRNSYRDALEHLVPPPYDIVNVPNGFKSAEWKRERSHELAQEYVRDTTIDIVVAIGPWVVEDLLKAGFTRPIVGLLQFDPAAQGLIGRDGRPVAPNLTVHVQSDRLKNDIQTIAELYHPKQIGVLAFNSSPDDTAVYNKCWKIGKAMGIDVKTACAYGASGTYAFFKAYAALPRTVEALYVSPLWGMSLSMIDQFVTDLRGNHVALFTSEGRPLVDKGVLGSGAVRTEQSAALFAAWKTVKIIQGAVPADLPLEYSGPRGYVLNGEAIAILGRDISPERLAEAEMVKEYAPTEDEAMLSSKEAVAKALAQNSNYQAIYATLDAAARQIDLARSGYLPSVTLDASATQASKGAMDNSDGIISRGRQRAGVSVEQKLFSMETIRSIEIARQERKLTEATVAQAGRDLEWAVGSAYMDCLAARERISQYSILRSSIEDFRETARFHDFTSQDGPDDQPRWEKFRMDILRRIIEERHRYQAAVAILNTLLGQPDAPDILLDSAMCTEGALLEQYSTLRPIIISPRFGAKARQFVEAEAIKGNALMAATSASVLVQGANLGLTKAKRYPGIGLNGWFGYVDSLADRNGFDEKHNLWSLNASLSWPLFRGGAGKHEQAIARAGLDQAEYEKDAARLKVVSAVQVDWRQIASVGEQMPLAAEAAALAGSHLDSTRFDYLAGRRSLGEALDAVQSDFDARMTLMDTRFAYFQAVSDLLYDMGWSASNVTEDNTVYLVTKIQAYLRSTLPSNP